MHDVGRLGLVKSYAPDMTPVMNAEYGCCDEVLAAEKAAVSVDHGTAGSWLVKTWGLPQDFADICAHHHDGIAQTDPALLKVVKGACRIADALGFSAVKYREPATYQRVVACFPVHQQRRFPDEAELREAVQNRLSSVQG
jgi:HD-like signal output (HDOD) protein